MDKFPLFQGLFLIDVKDPIKCKRDEANKGVEKCSVEINLKINPESL